MITAAIELLEILTATQRLTGAHKAVGCDNHLNCNNEV